MANIRKECIRGEERKVISLFSRVFVSFCCVCARFVSICAAFFSGCAPTDFGVGGGATDCAAVLSERAFGATRPRGRQESLARRRVALAAFATLRNR